MCIFKYLILQNKLQNETPKYWTRWSFQSGIKPRQHPKQIKRPWVSFRLNLSFHLLNHDEVKEKKTFKLTHLTHLALQKYPHAAVL